MFLTAWLNIKRHCKGHVIYLSRMEVRSGTGVDTMVSLLHTWDVIGFWQRLAHLQDEQVSLMKDEMNESNSHTMVFQYLGPYNAIAGNIQDIYSRCIHIRALQCTRLMSVACQRICCLCFISFIMCCVHHQPEPELSAAIPVKVTTRQKFHSEYEL